MCLIKALKINSLDFIALDYLTVLISDLIALLVFQP